MPQEKKKQGKYGRQSDKPKNVTKSREVLAAETIVAVVTSGTVQEAADKLGISRQMVHERIKRYELKDRIAELKTQALTELQLGATKAARKLVDLVDSEDEKIAKGASDSVLDRIGLTKPDNSGANTIIFNKGDIVGNKYIDKD